MKATDHSAPHSAPLPLPDTRRLPSRQSRRKRWLTLHLWLGLVAGLVLVPVGLTGSVLVFWQEIDDWLNPELRVVRAEAGAGFAPLERIQAAAEAALPPGAVFGFGYYPRHQRAAFQLFYDHPAEDGGADHYQAFVNPYTAQVTGTRLLKKAMDWFPRSFVPFVFQLHYGLLLGGVGSIIVGIVGALLMISVITGLILWWPRPGKLRQALTFKRRASPERFIFDLHKTSGFYTGLVLLAVLLSGVSMNLPDQFNAVVELFSPLTLPGRVHSKPHDGLNPIGWSLAAETVDRLYPEGRLAWVQSPAEGDGVYQVCKRGVNSLNRFVGFRCGLVDQYSGVLLKLIDPEKGSGGDVFRLWQWPLHSGQAFGWTGRILVFITGLAGPVLFVTGLIRWLQKRRVARRNAGESVPGSPETEAVHGRLEDRDRQITARPEAG